MINRLKFNLEDLVNEMLDRLPEEVFKSNSTTFLDPEMGGGQFVTAIEERLRKYGHSDTNISKRVFGLTVNRLRLNYAKSNYNLIGTYCIGDFLTKEYNNMKFDVIIGNPPYQETDKNGRSKSNSGSNLYSKFIDKGLKILVEDGYLAFITPTAWAGYDAKIGKPFRNKQLLFLNLNECKKYFKGIGSTFSWYVMHNKAPYTVTDVISEFKGTLFKGSIKLYDGYPFVPHGLDKNTLSILDKVYKSDFERYSYVRDSKLHSQKVKITKTKTKYPAFHFSHANGFYSEIPHPTLYKVPKLMVGPGRLGLKGEFGYLDLEGTFNPTQNSINTTILTEEEGNSKLIFLRSKLTQFLLRITEHGSYWEKKMLLNLPYVECMTEEDLYEKLSLTEEEINLIEYTVG